MGPAGAIALFLAASVPAGGGWERALAPRAWRFPQDHAAHHEFQTEWWQFTGHLTDEDGHPFGFQLTFVRQGLDRGEGEWLPEVGFPPGRSEWRIRDVHFAHFAVSDIRRRRFRHFEAVNREALGRAATRDDTLHVWNSGWAATVARSEPFICELQAAEGDIALRLTMHALKPPVLQGQDGLSRKSADPGKASHCYSFTRMSAEGGLRVEGKPLRVHGSAWMDHEFSTSALAPDQAGWDRFSMQLDNNEEITICCMRRRDGSIDPVSEATLIDALGGRRVFPAGEFHVHATGAWPSPRSHATYPTGWEIEIPAAACRLRVSPRLPNQELNLSGLGPLSYWEGACTIEGTRDDIPVTGLGYTELTGYATDLSPGLNPSSSP